MRAQLIKLAATLTLIGFAVVAAASTSSSHGGGSAGGGGGGGGPGAGAAGGHAGYGGHSGYNFVGHGFAGLGRGSAASTARGNRMGVTIGPLTGSAAKAIHVTPTRLKDAKPVSVQDLALFNCSQSGRCFFHHPSPPAQFPAAICVPDSPDFLNCPRAIKAALPAH